MQPTTPYCLPEIGAHVMGVLNITPDSFSDGGKFNSRSLALERAREMIAEGADIIDVGAESTRPGSTPLSLEDEWARLDPVLEEICTLGVPVSVDTYKPEIAKRACAKGAAIINDVWGLQKDPAMADVVAEAGVHIVMMHNRMGAEPVSNIMADIDEWFERSMELARKAGIPSDKQILDPGLGFGKTMDQNYQILNRFEELKKHGLPVLSGASRKRMIAAALKSDSQDRLFGTLAAHLISMQKGAKIVRVHDVLPHVHARLILNATLKESAQ